MPGRTGVSLKPKKKIGKKKLVTAALWTEVCLATAAPSALDDGYEPILPQTHQAA